MRRLLIIGAFAVLFAFPPGHGQSSGQRAQDDVGYYYTVGDSIQKFDWQAYWIWTEDSLNHNVILTRRKFELTDVPDQAQLMITASSQYRLYINGVYVRRGPARSAPHHQSFDVLNVLQYLKTGTNVLAIRVHHQDNKHSYHFKGRAGLLAQLNLDFSDRKETIISDADWQMIADPSWDNSAPVINRFQMVVNDRVDMRNACSEWWISEYDDSEWNQATPLMRNVGWPAPEKHSKPQPLTPPWTSLVPRDIPYIYEMEVESFKLIEARPIKDDYLADYKTIDHKVVSGISLSNHIDKDVLNGFKNYQAKEKPIHLPDDSNFQDPYLVLFDFESVLNGIASLELQGSEGSEVELLYAPYLIDNRFCYNVIDSEFRDRIILSGKKDLWEATYFKPFRYLALIIHPTAQPVTLYKLDVRHFKYPFKRLGQIQSSDAEWVARYMEATRKTIDVCTTDAYTDNYRERRQYAQTGYYGAMGNYWTFGDHALQRRYLIQVAQEQEPNGIMPAYAPLGKDDYMVILDSNCLYIRSLRNYYLYSGDKLTATQLLPAAYKLMELLHSYTNESGMIDNPPYPYWLDHVQNDRIGANLNLNGHYLGALNDFADILNWLSDDQAQIYLNRAKILKRNLNKLWNEDKGLFVDALIDGQHSNHYSEGANAMALACGVANTQQAAAIAEKLFKTHSSNYIFNDSGMTMVTPAMSYFLHKGLCDFGYVNESFEMFRNRFDTMLSPPHNGTLWEEWWLKGTGRSGKFNSAKSRSDAQTESAFAPALFAEYLLGVQPLQPGFREVELRKSNSDLRNIEGTVPTPLGQLVIEWNFADRMISVIIPEGMIVKVNVNSLDSSVDKITVDGKVLWSEVSHINLLKGHHEISY